MTIKSLRRSLKLTQNEFAKKCNIARSTVAMWETGKSSPSLFTANQIAKIFNVDINYLLNENLKKNYDLFCDRLLELIRVASYPHDILVKESILSKDEMDSIMDKRLLEYPNRKTIYEIAKFLNTSYEYLISGDEKTKNVNQNGDIQNSKCYNTLQSFFNNNNLNPEELKNIDDELNKVLRATLHLTKMKK